MYVQFALPTPVSLREARQMAVPELSLRLFLSNEPEYEECWQPKQEQIIWSVLRCSASATLMAEYRL